MAELRPQPAALRSKIAAIRYRLRLRYPVPALPSVEVVCVFGAAPTLRPVGTPVFLPAARATPAARTSARRNVRRSRRPGFAGRSRGKSATTISLGNSRRFAQGCGLNAERDEPSTCRSNRHCRQSRVAAVRPRDPRRPSPTAPDPQPHVDPRIARTRAIQAQAQPRRSDQC